MWGHSGAGSRAENRVLGALWGGRQDALRPPDCHSPPTPVNSWETTSKARRVGDRRGFRNHLIYFASEETESQGGYKMGPTYIFYIYNIVNYGLEALPAPVALDTFRPLREGSGTCWGQQGARTGSLSPFICLLSALPRNYSAGFGVGGEEWAWDGVSALRIPALVWKHPSSPSLEASERRSRWKMGGGENGFPQDLSLIFLLPLTHFHRGDRRE